MASFVIHSPKHGDYTILVDDEDYERVMKYNWTLSKYTFPNGRINYHIKRIIRMPNGKKTNVILSRFILNVTDPNLVVDHISGDQLDNRKSNLRAITQAQNAINTKKYYNNTSGYKGVSYHKRERLWCAQIYLNRKKYHLGYFYTPEEAYKAYCEASKKYHGEFARV